MSTMGYSGDLAESTGRSYAELTRDYHWSLRILVWLLTRFKPALGWPILFCTLLLAYLPGQVANLNEWIELPRSSGAIIVLGPLGVLTAWLFVGWRRSRYSGRTRLQQVLVFVAVLLLGLLALLQSLSGWLPGLGRLLHAAFSDGWAPLWQQMMVDLARLGNRFLIWWQGVQAGGATQDNVVFAGMVGLVLWCAGGLTGWLVRRYQRGLLAAVPILWLMIQSLLYGTGGRWMLIVTLAVVFLLHLLLDHQRLERQWTQRDMSFSSGLLLDRTFYVACVGLLILTVAALIPSLYIRPLSVAYYDLIAPINDQAESFGERLFPELKATSRFGGSPAAGGLPNSFLLGGGQELSQRIVMNVRTDEPIYYEPEFAGEAQQQVGHYMRGGTFSLYDGLGWHNPPNVERVRNPAGEPVMNIDMTGRKLLRQDVFPEYSGSALYAAPEAVEPVVDYRVDYRAAGDVVALWADTGSYTVVSAVPAVSASQLDRVPNRADDAEIPPLLQPHLALPDSVTERTRALASELTAGLEGPFAKATALEAYLRTIEYDLTISEPPAEVTDVADYFLFELERGYCDYYATAFVVMARSLGLPARFATGFAKGRFDPSDTLWVITEAEAHSWPEVYFEQYGWIPFEPTGGRSSLERIGLPEESEFVPGLPAGNGAAVAAPPEEADTFAWNWQMLVWLIPLGLLGYGLFVLARRLLVRPVDPWQGLLRWGARAGRPLAAGETILEYGSGLADHALEQYRQREQDTGRFIAHEVRALSEEVSAVHYAEGSAQQLAESAASQRWETLRGYLRRRWRSVK